MSVETAAQTLLNEFAGLIGLPTLDFNPEGFCTIGIDQNIIIDIQYAEERDDLILFSDLGIPASGAEIYETLLKANLFWRATLGATLSLSQDETPHVVLALAVRWKELDANQFEAIFDRFVNTIEDWSELLRKNEEDNEYDIDPMQGGILQA